MLAPVRILVCLLTAIGLGLVAAPAAAQPAGRLDVDSVLAALNAGERVVRAPGAVARFDEARVLEEMGSDGRLAVLPYVDHDVYEENGESQYFELVMSPLSDWARERDVPLLVATGLDVHLYDTGSRNDNEMPADLDELRTTLSTNDITQRLIVNARLGAGYQPDAAEKVEIAHPAPVPAAPERVAEVVDALRAAPVYNAPGRALPVDDWVAATARDKYGLGIRVAAFPLLEPGQPVVDYATPLGAAFPDDVVMVVHGDWMDIVAPDQRKAEAARAFAYSDADLSLFVSGLGSNRTLLQTVKRLELLLTETSWGYPQPPPQPRPVPFDVQRTVSTLAPWVLVGSAVALGGVGVLRRRTRAADEERALRLESASAMAVIGDLGARVLAAEEKGKPLEPAAAERHATALLLYDQAHTPVAMTEVRLVAEEGLAMVTEPEPEKAEKTKKAKARGRKKAR